MSDQLVLYSHLQSEPHSKPHSSHIQKGKCQCHDHNINIEGKVIIKWGSVLPADPHILYISQSVT